MRPLDKFKQRVRYKAKKLKLRVCPWWSYEGKKRRIHEWCVYDGDDESVYQADNLHAIEEWLDSPNREQISKQWVEQNKRQIAEALERDKKIMERIIEQLERINHG